MLYRLIAIVFDKGLSNKSILLTIHSICSHHVVPWAIPGQHFQYRASLPQHHSLLSWTKAVHSNIHSNLPKHMHTHSRLHSLKLHLHTVREHNYSQRASMQFTFHQNCSTVCSRQPCHICVYTKNTHFDLGEWKVSHFIPQWVVQRETIQNPWQQLNRFH